MHHVPADRGTHLLGGQENLLVELHDMIFDGDELELAAFRYCDTYRFAGIFDNLLIHGKTPAPARPARIMIVSLFNLKNGA